jgi:hypothetical protein
MNLERIRQRVPGGEFHPFALRTSDGREYVVRHPEMVLVAPRYSCGLQAESSLAELGPHP